MGNLGPGAVVNFETSQELRIFLWCPRATLEVGIEELAPAFLALLGNAAWHHFGNLSPVVYPHGLDRSA